jgi:hypothetical protein
MSQENVELQHRLTDAFNRRDFDAMLALTDKDVELIPRVGGWKVAMTATTESVAGGPTCSALSQTSASSFMRCKTWGEA